MELDVRCDIDDDEGNIDDDDTDDDAYTGSAAVSDVWFVFLGDSITMSCVDDAEDDDSSGADCGDEVGTCETDTAAKETRDEEDGDSI